MASDASADPAPPRSVSAQVAALVAGQLGLHAAMSGLRMAAPLEALSQGSSPLRVGVLLALFALAPVFIAIPVGRLADRQGYHRPMRLAVALSVLGGLLAVAATRVGGDAHFALMCLAATLSGSAANVGVIVIQRTAGLLARDPVERVRVFSWLGVAPSLANVIGPVSVGLMIDAAGFGAAYGLMLALPLATVAVMRRVPVLAPVARPADAAPGGSVLTLLRLPGMRRLLVVNWLLSACWDVHAFAVPVLGHGLGFSASTIGMILGSFTASVTVVRFLIPWLAHRVREVTALRWAMVGTALVFALYPLARQPLAMAALAVALGLTLGSVQPMVMATLHRLSPESRHGEAIALRSVTINLCSTVMPLAFGVLGAAAGVALLFWAMAGGVGAGSWIARRLQPAPA